MQLDWLDGPTTAPCGPVLALVSHFPKAVCEPEPTTLGICGPTSFASSPPDGPLSSWESRLRKRLAMVGSTESALIWRLKVTPAGASISRLAAWTLPNSEAASIGALWLAPKASTAGETSRSGKRKNELLMGGMMRGLAAMERSGQGRPGLAALTPSSGGLNPAHPCWLMGFPAEWLHGAASATLSCHNWQPK